MASAIPVLVGGVWRESSGSATFESVNPATGEALVAYPISEWDEIDAALSAGHSAYEELRDIDPKSVASMLAGFADRIERNTAELAAVAAKETGLPAAPRLSDVEIPRTVNQLRMAGAAAQARDWVEPILSPGARLASWLAPTPGVVPVFGPNNFPFAFNGVGGGDFAAAIATGHPVLAKANPGHPETTRLLASEALQAADAAGLPEATIQMVYRTSHDDGARIVADPRVAATAYTGSRSAGLALKRSADASGKPIYLEMSSVNPVVVLPGVLSETPDVVASTLVASVLLGAGQFCTSPGIVFVTESAGFDQFMETLAAGFRHAPVATLLTEGVATGLSAARAQWVSAGAKVVASGQIADADGPTFSYPATLLWTSAADFLLRSEELQTEAFGSMMLVVRAPSVAELVRCVDRLEGNLTGTVFVSVSGSDDGIYPEVAGRLREKVGRLVNNKAPTGVAVDQAMNHGGPYPSTGHAGFTAVGVPTSFRRFANLQSFDNVADSRLPPELQAANPLGLMRRVDDEWTRSSIEWARPSEPD